MRGKGVTISWPDALMRWRHTRGFGVHSPFAFSFLTDVVRPLPSQYAYYASGKLRELTRQLPKRLRAEYAMLFRLCARQSPRQVCLSANTETNLASALALIVGKKSVHTHMPQNLKKGTLAVCSAIELDRLPALESGVALVIRYLTRKPQVLHQLIPTLPGGWVFEGLDSAIIITDGRQNICTTKILLP